MWYTPRGIGGVKKITVVYATVSPYPIQKNFLDMAREKHQKENRARRINLRGVPNRVQKYILKRS